MAVLSAKKKGQKLIQFLSERKGEISPLLILTHDFPDPDAIAGACALQFLAETAFGIRSRIVYRGAIGRVENRNMVRILKLPVHKLRPWEIRRYPNIALVDTQPQFENNPFPKGRKATIVIDQHPSDSAPPADLAIIDPECGATSVMLAQAIFLLNLDVPEELATALTYGILSDTFQLYRAHRKDIVETYLRLLPKSNIRALARIQVPCYEKGYFSILSRCLSRSFMQGGLIACHLEGIPSPDFVSQMADFLLSYKQAGWSLCTGRFKDKLYVSLRTRTMDIPAFTILRKCVPEPEDAGGHGQIAGGSLRMDKVNEERWRQEEQDLVNKILKHLGISPKRKRYYPF